MAKLLPFGLLMDAEGIRWINECKPVDELSCKLGELLIQAYSEGLISFDCSNFNKISERNGVCWLAEDDTGQTNAVSVYLPDPKLPATSIASMSKSGAYQIVWKEGEEQGEFTEFGYQHTYVYVKNPYCVTEHGSWYCISIQDGKVVETPCDRPWQTVKDGPHWIVTYIDAFNTLIDYKGNRQLYQHPSEHWLLLGWNVLVLIDRESITKIHEKDAPSVYKFADPIMEWRGDLILCCDGSIWDYAGELRQIDQAVLKNSRKQPISA